MENELISDTDVIKELVLLYHHYNPSRTAKQIYVIWEKSKIFKEYERPEVTQLVDWIKEFEALP